MALLMGIAHRTYASYERSERLPDADALAPLVREGWNANWLLTGEGPERLEASSAAESPAPYASQSVRPSDLTIALEMADEKLARDQLWLPKAQYAELVVLILERLHQGWAYQRIRALVDAALDKLADGEGAHAGGSGGVGAESEGGPGNRRAEEDAKADT